VTSHAISLLVLEGDGIGPEIVAATVRVVRAAAAGAGIDLAIASEPIGFAALAALGTTFPPQVIEAARAADGVILGPVQHNDYPDVARGGVNPSGELRRQLDLFANIRPAREFAGVPRPSRHPIDLVIVRENTEGFYADRSMFLGPGEFMPTPDVALAVRKVTRQASERILRSAFELAMLRRRKLTVVHKANVLRLSDGLFLQCARELASRYPEVAYEERLVDAMAALLVRDSSRFDTIVTTNMFGDILSDQASELAGGLGLAASINASADHVVAQAQHGSAPDLAGLDRANPASLIGSVAMMLRWLSAKKAMPQLNAMAKRIEAALAAALTEPATRTADLGGDLGTRAFAEHVAAGLDTAGPAASQAIG
jgi:3-isopropylmalate dehydrogenase